MADDEALAMVCALTGLDEQAAHQYLEAADGNVEVAVGLAMDSTDKPIIAHESTQEARHHEGTRQEEGVRRPIAPSRGVLVDSIAGGGGWIDPIATRRPAAASPFASFVDSVDLSTERGRRLAELYRHPTRIQFVGTFDAARKQAKQQHRYLLVTLHDPSDFQCQMLNRDLWNVGAVQDFVLDNLVFLQLAVGTEEADRYMRFYPVTGHPHLSLLDPRTGKAVRTWHGRIPEPMELVGEIIEYSEAHPLASRTPVQHPHLPETIVIDDTDIEEDETEDTDEIEDTDEEMGEEPAVDAPRVTTLQLRLPDGSRVRRRFLLDQPVQDIFRFVAKTLGVPPASVQVLEHTRSLSDQATQSLAEAGLKNSSLNVSLQ